MTNSDSQYSDRTLIRLFQFGEGAVREEAAARFVERYFAKLVSMIEPRIADRFLPRFSAEDVVQSAMKSWFKRIDLNRRSLDEHDDIWKLISVIALNKVRKNVRRHSQQRRSVQTTDAGDSVFDNIPGPSTQDALEYQDFLAAVHDSLPEKCRQVIPLLLEGHTWSEIASRMNVSTRTICRYKDQIREVALKHLPEDARVLAEDLLTESSDGHKQGVTGAQSHSDLRQEPFAPPDSTPAARNVLG